MASMPVSAESIRRLTRALIGARVYQGLLFCFVLVHNVAPVLITIGYPNPRLQMWLTLCAIVGAGTVGSYYQWRFGRVEPQRPSLPRQVGRATVLALLIVVAVMAIVALAGKNEDWPALSGARPMDLIWVMLSAGTAMSMAISRGERMGWVVPLLASLGLLLTLVVPTLQPYRALGHAVMAAALIVTAIQLHLFLVRGFRLAHV
jgi:hypothetical protein